MKQHKRPLTLREPDSGSVDPRPETSETASGSASDAKPRVSTEAATHGKRQATSYLDDTAEARAELSDVSSTTLIVEALSPEDDSSLDVDDATVIFLRPDTPGTGGEDNRPPRQAGAQAKPPAPPTLRYVGNDGSPVVEEQVLVGHVVAPRSRQRYLEDHGVDLRFATFDPVTDRWERCLFSYAVADLLQELRDEGDFPFDFLAVPSLAEVERQRQQAEMDAIDRDAGACDPGQEGPTGADPDEDTSVERDPDEEYSPDQFALHDGPSDFSAVNGDGADRASTRTDLGTRKFLIPASREALIGLVSDFGDRLAPEVRRWCVRCLGANCEAALKEYDSESNLQREQE